MLKPKIWAKVMCY